MEAASKEAQNEILKYEEIRSEEADAKIDAVYDEIRPAIEERERDNQGSVPTVLAGKWIEATCLQMKANFDLNFSIVKNALWVATGFGKNDCRWLWAWECGFKSILLNLLIK